MFTLVVVVLCLLIGNSCSTSSVDSFMPSPPTIQLSRLAVDSQSGTVYVGAVNHVYQLDSNLTLVVDVTTGPVQDDINCVSFNATGHLNCNPLQTSLTDNYNQVRLFNGLSGIGRRLNFVCDGCRLTQQLRQVVKLASFSEIITTCSISV